MSTSQHPARIGRYSIQKPIGSGAMGDVYLAHDPNIDRQLALKTVRVIGGSDEDIEDRKQRLLREARAAGRLIHPNVVALFDAGEADGLLYLAFEFVAGQDLLKRARTPPELTLREILRTVRETASALDYAHQQDIVHRDIKPSNILIGTRGEAKVADFGIAKLRDQSTELTRTGSVVGSPQYMSPEQIRGDNLDGRSDLFSLGVVFYELLSRTRPFGGDTISTLVFEILAKEPPPIESLRPGLPPRLVNLVRWMLAKDRNQRVPTARQVVSEIDAAEREIPAGVLDRPLSDNSPDNQPTRLMPSGADSLIGTGAATPPPFASGPNLAKGGSSGNFAAPAGTPPAFPSAVASAAPSITPPPYPTSSAPGAYQGSPAFPPPPGPGTYAPGPQGQVPQNAGGPPPYPSPPPYQGPPTSAPPGQGYGPPPPGYGQPPAPARSGGNAGKIIIALVAFSLLGLIGLGALFLMMSGDDPKPADQVVETPPSDGTADPATDAPTDDTADSPAETPTEDADGDDTASPAEGYNTFDEAAQASNGDEEPEPERPTYTPPTRPTTPPPTRPPSTPPTTPDTSPRDDRGPLARLGEAAGRATEGTGTTTPPIRPPVADEPENEAWQAAASSARQEIESGLRFQFKVTPPEARVLFWAPEDRRAIVQGAVAEFDPKRDEEARVLELPGDGEFLLVIRHGDFPDYVIKVNADRSRGDKPKLLQLSLGGGARSAVIKVSKGVSFAGTPDDAYVIVDGKNRGRASDYPGARRARSEDNLKLDRGIHIIRLEAEGYKPWEVRVEVSGGSPAIEQVSYKLEKDP